jgi:hypothetical protein
MIISCHWSHTTLIFPLPPHWFLDFELKYNEMVIIEYLHHRADIVCFQ